MDVGQGGALLVEADVRDSGKELCVRLNTLLCCQSISDILIHPI